MDVFKIAGKLVLFGKEQFDKDIGETKEKGSNLATSIGKSLSTAAKVGAAAIGACATAVGALTKASIDGFAQYEQLVGGSQLLFGDAYGYVAEQAKNAYRDVQMSQNEYLQQVNGFATGLKTALGGNEQAAAELAAKIIKAEADVVAATGNSQEAVQNAFNGIMKSNFTMLDNLQLGITPTKEGFKTLIEQVNAYNKELGKTTNYQIDNLADCQAALVDYIEMQGLADYASMEAAKTIQGSLAMAKAAWKNFVAGLADESQDLDALIGNLVDSVTVAAHNIVPRVVQILGGISVALEQIIPIVSAELPVLMEQLLPGLISGATSLVVGLVQSLPSIVGILIAALPGVISQLASALVSVFPVLMDTIKSLFAQVWDYIAVELLGTEADFESTFSVIGEVCSTAFDEIRGKVDELRSVFDSKFGDMADAAVGAWNAIVEAYSPIVDILGGLFELAVMAIQITWDVLPSYFGAIMDTITGIFSVVEAVLSGDFQAAWDAIMSIVDAWEGYFQGIWESIKAVFGDAVAVGARIIQDIQAGINSAWEGLASWFKGIWDSLFGNLSANVSVNASSSGTDGSHASGLDYVPFDGYIAELHKGEMVVPAAEARMLRSGNYGSAQDERIAGILAAMLDINQEMLQALTAGQTFKVGEREFARLVKKYA